MRSDCVQVSVTAGGKAPATNSRHAAKRPPSADISEATSLAHGNVSKWPRCCRSRAAALSQFQAQPAVPSA